MDQAKLKRRQNLKVIISEVIMVLTVIVTVVILAFVVSGYWINSDFEVERQGMLQIYSIPTGADVSIDGKMSSWLQRTNTSKVLAAGEHTIVLTKDGYDSWSKVVNVNEGLLYRLHYPRLFLQDREKLAIYDAVGTTGVFVSDDNESMLLFSGSPDTLDLAVFKNPAANDEEYLSTLVPEWSLLDLTADEPNAKPVDYRTLYDFFEEPENNKISKKPTKDPVSEFGLGSKLTGSEELIFTKFYDESYLIVRDGNVVSVYEKNIPEAIITAELSFTPDNSYAGHNGEFVIFSAGASIATLDMESSSIVEWTIDGDSFSWLDDDMVYSVKDGELFVYDYDGLNRRLLVYNVSERFPVILVNNKWLYYFSDDNLMRETVSN